MSDVVAGFRGYIRPSLVALPAAGLAVGLAAHFFAGDDWSRWIWSAATIPVLLVLLVEIVSSLRRGDVGLDIVAALSMLAALVFGEYLAAVIVALMYAGGQYLESFAERRASRDMTALLARAPRTAIRHRDGRLEEVGLDAIEPGDRLLVRQGDVVPVDGAVEDGVAVLDQSALTGEAMPVQHNRDDAIMSGSSNVGAAFDMVASRRAAESTYAGIVRLVAAAQRSRAPMSRLADRYAVAFLAATIMLAGVAWFCERRSDPRGRGARRGDPVSAHSCRAGRDRVGPLARRQAGHSDQRREGAGDAGASARAGVRQDRDADTWPSQDRVDQCRSAFLRRRDPAACGLARPGVQAHHCPDPGE